VGTECIDVTVVVSNYNQAPLIVGALDFLAQSDFLPKLEIMVVDDCSSQGFAEVESAIRLLRDREVGKASLIRARRNLGVSAVRNIGLENAQGRFVCFHDGDDLWLDGWKVAVSELDRNGFRVLGTGEKAVTHDKQIHSLSMSSINSIAQTRTHPIVKFPLDVPVMSATFLVAADIKTRFRSFLCRPTSLWPGKPPGWEDAVFWIEACAENVGRVGRSGINRIRQQHVPESSWHDGRSGFGWMSFPIIRPDLFTEAAIEKAVLLARKKKIEPDMLRKFALLSEEEILNGPILFDRVL